MTLPPTPPYLWIIRTSGIRDKLARVILIYVYISNSSESRVRLQSVPLGGQEPCIFQYSGGFQAERGCDVQTCSWAQTNPQPRGVVAGWSPCRLVAIYLCDIPWRTEYMYILPVQEERGRQAEQKGWWNVHIHTSNSKQSWYCRSKTTLLSNPPLLHHFLQTAPSTLHSKLRHFLFKYSGCRLSFFFFFCLLLIIAFICLGMGPIDF